VKGGGRPKVVVLVKQGDMACDSTYLGHSRLI
jgi:hypothetical protein